MMNLPLLTSRLQTALTLSANRRHSRGALRLTAQFRSIEIDYLVVQSFY